jgi:hypothetical protein
MSIRRMAALLPGVLLVTMFASAASVKNTMRIEVLDSETRAASIDNNDVSANCEQLTFDAYCRSTSTAPLVSTLLVQEGNAPPFRIRCTIESRYSRCTSLPKGERFDARREKKGITVYYVDDKGRGRKQSYTLVDTDGKLAAPATATTAAVATQPVPVATAPQQSSPPLAPAAPAVSAQAALPEKVRCNFSSTPSGAEISIDWQYVGNTPSEIGLSAGTHIVVISKPGFAEWKRDLTVLPGSELTVSTALQKMQQ